MLSRLDLIEKLNVMLEAKAKSKRLEWVEGAGRDPTSLEKNPKGWKITRHRIVNLEDITDSRRSLNISVAPNMGWEDYINGKPYRPPTDYRDPHTAVGPADGTAYNTVKGEPVPSNPHSADFGGVRPWSRDEIFLSFMDVTPVSNTFFPEGLKSFINTTEKYHQASKPGVPFVWEEYSDMALMAIYKALIKDKGFSDIPFTGMLKKKSDLMGGSGASLHGEHRVVRGILAAYMKNVRMAARAVDSGMYDVDALVDIIVNSGAQKKLKHVDAEIPLEKNKFGSFAGMLVGLRDGAIAAIDAGDSEALLQLSERAVQEHGKVSAEEEQHRGGGVAQGLIGSQPRDLAAIGTGAHRILKREYKAWLVLKDFDVSRVEEDESGKVVDFESIGTIHTWSPEQAIKILKKSGVKINPRTTKAEEIEGSKELKELDDVSGDAETRVRAAILKKYPGDTEIELKEIEGSGAGYGSVQRLDAPLKPGEDDPRGFAVQGALQRTMETNEMRDDVMSLLHNLRYGSRRTREGQIKRTVDVVDELEAILDHLANPTPRHKFEARPDTSGPGSEGFKIIDVDKKQVVGTVDTEGEASNYLRRLNNPIVASLEYAASNADPDKLGPRYYKLVQQNISDIESDILPHRRPDDIEFIREELRDLKLELKKDLETMVAGGSSAPLLTTTEYRISLRKLGLSNYPERGTINDPEIGEDGELSLWAQAGYPTVQHDASKGKGTLQGTLHTQEGEPGEMVVDKHIATDLGLSPQSIGNIWRKVQVKLSNVMGEQIEQYRWEGMDEYDLQVIREFRMMVLSSVIAECSARPEQIVV